MYNQLMGKLVRTIFFVILIFSVYHTIRDTLQVFGIHNSFTNVFHRSHVWCKAYCDFVTYPLNLIGVVGSFIILKRNRIGWLGYVILFSLPFWLLVLVP